MGDCCIYDRLEQCFHDCDNCPQARCGEDNGVVFDPYDKYDRED